jgi:ribonuclease R
MARHEFDADPASARKAVLAFLSQADTPPVTTRELLRRMHVPREAGAAVRDAVRDLLREKKITRTGNLLAPASSSDDVTGRIAVDPRGFGVVKPDRGGPEVYVPHRGLKGASDGNQVKLRLIRGKGIRGKTEGTVIDVLDRRGRRLLGALRLEGKRLVLEPFVPSEMVEAVVPPANLAGAEPGDAVEVELLRPARGGGAAEAKVVAVLGKPGDPGVDIDVVTRVYGLQTAFPREVLAEAARLPDAVPHAEASRRERFEDPPVVTIDGETARDFDDAISVEELPGGGYRLFVHIADVAYFVPEGSILDIEARKRGTSVYFPDRVLPMFPEQLSNELCSLRAGRERLVQSVILDIDASGVTRAVRFADGVIRAAARLTYTEVAEIFEGRQEAPSKPVAAMLRLALALSEKLLARREARGSIDFDFPEPKVLFNLEGVMTGIRVEPRNHAHRLIEECMLAANEAVAGHLAERSAPCLYRVHDSPDPLKIEALESFAAGLGIRLDVDPAEIRPKDLQRFLSRAEERPEYPVLSQVVLRSMKQARYSVENSGHFGLAAPVYCHFTSPIRRYPDLVVHRTLRALRSGRAGETDDLPSLAESCSRLERAAEAAEREVLLWRKIAFMRGREGEVLEGVVTGVTRFGLFVQLTETLVEGLLHVAELGDERFHFDERRMRLRGDRTGTTYGLGDRLDVVVARVDPVLRRIDLVPEGRQAPRARREERHGRGAPRRREPKAEPKRARGRRRS